MGKAIIVKKKELPKLTKTGLLLARFLVIVGYKVN